MNARFLLRFNHLVNLREQFAFIKEKGYKYLTLTVTRNGCSWRYIKDDAELKKALLNADAEDAKPDNNPFKERLVALFSADEEIIIL
ncbi:MAG: hypothetical protein HYW71_02490 [Candidatus Niyogibacteria bacterium]|nr:hypothetical protein [Candidatus Niyogibacteria bacterium]